MILLVLRIISVFILVGLYSEILSFNRSNVFPSSPNLFHNVQHLHIRKLGNDLRSSFSDKNHVGRQALFRFINLFIVKSILFFKLSYLLKLSGISLFVLVSNLSVD